MNVRLNHLGKELLNHKCTINEIPTSLENYNFLIGTLKVVIEQLKNENEPVTEELVNNIFNNEITIDDFFEDMIENKELVLTEKEWRELVEKIVEKTNRILESNVESLYTINHSKNLDFVELKLNLTVNLEDMVGFLYYIDDEEEKNIEDYNLDLSKKGIQRIFSYRSQRAYEYGKRSLDKENSIINNLDSVSIRKEDIIHNREENLYLTTISILISIDSIEQILEKDNKIEKVIEQLSTDINTFVSTYKEKLL